MLDQPEPLLEEEEQVSAMPPHQQQAAAAPPRPKRREILEGGDREAIAELLWDPSPRERPKTTHPTSLHTMELSAPFSSLLNTRRPQPPPLNVSSVMKLPEYANLVFQASVAEQEDPAMQSALSRLLKAYIARAEPDTLSQEQLLALATEGVPGLEAALVGEMVDLVEKGGSAALPEWGFNTNMTTTTTTSGGPSPRGIMKGATFGGNGGRSASPAAAANQTVPILPMIDIQTLSNSSAQYNGGLPAPAPARRARAARHVPRRITSRPCLRGSRRSRRVAAIRIEARRPIGDRCQSSALRQRPPTHDPIRTS